MPGLKNDKHKRYTVVGREPAKPEPREDRQIAGVGVTEGPGGAIVELGVGRTLVPIQGAASRQITLLETDDDLAAEVFIRDYKGPCVGLHIIDSKKNKRWM